ncbi:hypothetical protein C8R45DRAFT_282429 [Mycena sanguinolenta]|nr:hypothetical protein C8R45DRAFT_282429 [Mycena sanguinolenta]
MYCSKECQRSAWPKHKAFCKQPSLNPLQIINSESSKLPPDNSRDDLEISDGQPPRNTKYPPIYSYRSCACCSKTEKQLPPGVVLKSCQSCKSIHYCGPECQKQDWHNHKSRCQANNLARVQAQQTEYPQMLNDLPKFYDSFKCELADCDINCLNLQMNPNAWKTHIFEVCLRYVPSRSKAINRFDVKYCRGRKISELNEPTLERLLITPKLKCLIETLSSREPFPLYIAITGEPNDDKTQSGWLVWQCRVDPHFSRWDPKWESDFIQSINVVQAGGPKLRQTLEELDPQYINKKHAARD